MANDLQATAVGGKLLFTFDWTPEISGSVTLTAVAYTLPTGISMVGSQSDDLANKKSSVNLQGFAHGLTQYVKAAGTLSTGEVIPKTLAVRGING